MTGKEVYRYKKNLNFNFNEDIYNQTLKVIVKEYIRGDIHFDGLEGLKEQLALDQLAVEKALNK
jgi:riboflavin kinase/FMN adenylyltransferase